MSISMLCTQCGSPAERCARCASARCQRRLCAELHEVACAVVSDMPPIAPAASPPAPSKPARKTRQRPERDTAAERLAVEQLVARISQHRQAGRAALLVGELDTAFDELWLARALEPDLDLFGAAGREVVPLGWDTETDLTPLARALSARVHPRASEAWRRVLDDAPARSIRAEAAEWLARDAFGAGQARAGLRVLHAAGQLGRATEAEALHAAYKQAGLDPVAAFGLYLAAARLDARSARATGLRDPLTDQSWPDQDPCWWSTTPSTSARRTHEPTDHQLEAFHRARDLAHTRRDHGWVMLAEGDFVVGPLGVPTLGRNVRSGSAEAADHDAFVRIRMAYEGAADRLPDVAWPWYRLAELLAWAGFEERAVEQLAQAEKRSLGGRQADRTQRPVLRALIQAGLGARPDWRPSTPRPFPAEPFAPTLAWRLRLR